MAKGDHQVQKVIDTLTAWKRRRGIIIEIEPYDNEEERIESILDWLNRPSS